MQEYRCKKPDCSAGETEACIRAVFSLAEILNYWYLLAMVLIGGQLGNFLNLKIFPTRILALITAFLVLFVAFRMGFRLSGIF